MNPKLKLPIGFILGMAALLAIAAVPLYQAVLQSNMNGGGYSITNLNTVSATHLVGEGSGITGVSGGGGGSATNATLLNSIAGSATLSVQNVTGPSNGASLQVGAGTLTVQLTNGPSMSPAAVAAAVQAATNTIAATSIVGTLTNNTTGNAATATTAGSATTAATATYATTAGTATNGYVVFNVKTYGAIGNGVADDTAAVNAAKNAAQQINGSVVYFPAGTYKVTPPIILTNNGLGSINGAAQNTISFIGDGQADFNSGLTVGSQIVFAFTNGNTPFCFETFGAGNCEIGKLILTAGSPGQTNKSTIIFTSGTRIHVYDCMLAGSVAGNIKGIQLGYFGVSTNTSQFSGTTNAPFGGYISVIERNTFWQVGPGVVGGNYCNGNVIKDNYFAGTGGVNIPAWIVFGGQNGNMDIADVFTGNCFEAGDSTHTYMPYVFIFTNCEGMQVNGNTVFDAGGGVLPFAYLDSTCVNNQFLGIGTDAAISTSTPIVGPYQNAWKLGYRENIPTLSLNGINTDFSIAAGKKMSFSDSLYGWDFYTTGDTLWTLTMDPDAVWQISHYDGSGLAAYTLKATNITLVGNVINPQLANAVVVTADGNGQLIPKTGLASATNFTGALAGDVTGTQGATVLASKSAVDGQVLTYSTSRTPAAWYPSNAPVGGGGNNFAPGQFSTNGSSQVAISALASSLLSGSIPQGLLYSQGLVSNNATGLTLGGIWTGPVVGSATSATNTLNVGTLTASQVDSGAAAANAASSSPGLGVIVKTDPTTGVVTFPSTISANSTTLPYPEGGITLDTLAPFTANYVIAGNGLSSDPTAQQPAFSWLSGSATISQLPSTYGTAITNLINSFSLACSNLSFALGTTYTNLFVTNNYAPILTLASNLVVDQGLSVQGTSSNGSVVVTNNLNLLGTIQINGTNATSGQVLTASDSSGHAVFKPAGTGTVISVTFTGDGTVLSSTPSSAVTTSGTVTASLLNAAANTLLGNPTFSSAAPVYTSSPTLSGTVSANALIATNSITLNGTAITSWPTGNTVPLFYCINTQVYSPLTSSGHYWYNMAGLAGTSASEFNQQLVAGTYGHIYLEWYGLAVSAGTNISFVWSTNDATAAFVTVTGPVGSSSENRYTFVISPAITVTNGTWSALQITNNCLAGTNSPTNMFFNLTIAP